MFAFLVASSLPTLYEDHNDDNEHEVSYHPELTITCEVFDLKKCKKEPCVPVEEKCEASKEGKRQGCFALWGTHNQTEAPVVEMKGCFIFHDNCDQKDCIDYKFEKNAGKNFCCCRHDMCNRDFKWQPTPTEASTTEDLVPEETAEFLNDTTKWIFASILLLTLIGFCMASKYYFSHRKQFNELPTMEPELSVSSQCLVIRPIDLIEIKAHGRFGTVWKGKMKTDDVAVKVFPTQDKQSWITEQEIYKLPRMNHPNILHFIGAEKHIFQDAKIEFWLITQYHTLGSLCDYLKSHTVSWQEMCKISESMARGLMHLHEEIPGTRTDDLKPAIAHRDFKSKNVLLKSDLTACVADFGLALRFTPGQPCGDVHGQVGTRRYMAPEILEGAINFNRDSFLRIDVYACGLVLWELVSRCTVHSGEVADYRLPFETELGSHPTLEEMQDNIAAKKMRPRINEEWRSHPVS